MNRTFEVGITATVVVTGVAEVVSAPLEDAGFDVQWLELSEGGGWMVRVFERQGTWIDGSIQDDPQEALLAVCERLLPPQKPSE